MRKIQNLLILLALTAPIEAMNSENLFPHPGFDRFDGDLPSGWSASVWNQRTTRVRYGGLEPDRDGTGSCFELAPTTPMAVVTLRSQSFPVAPGTGYLFKGHYASASELVTTDKKWMDAEGVSLVGYWLDEGGESAGSFTIALPSTQDRWIEIFEEVRAPDIATQLRIEVSRRWVGGRLRIDDFSLRRGTIADYGDEFRVRPAEEGDFFPIFGWLIPSAGILDRGAYGPDLKAGPDVSEDRLLAEYALANFNLGNEGTARFGTRFWAPIPESDSALVEFTQRPLFWGFSGKDEPGEERFAQLAEDHRRIQRLAPGTIYWINHLPTYGFGSEEHDALKEYDRFIQAYIDAVRPQLFTYDHYCLMGDPRTQADSWYSPNREQDYFANLEIVRERTLAAGVDFGLIVSVGTFGGVRGASEAELRWQAFTSLAYGSRLLGWFCYLTEVNYGHWTNWEDMVINRDGSRTRHYAMLKYLNAEVLNWGPTLLQLTSTGAYHTEPLPPKTIPIAASSLLRSVSGGMALVGEFVGGNGEAYAMVVNRDYDRPSALRVALSQPSRGLSRLSRRTGQWEPVEEYIAATGIVELELGAGDAELFRLEH